MLVAGFLVLHVLIWWLLPALLQHNLPLDVIEQLAWGREWQIVYFKHPPLPAWIVESVAVVSGRWPPALYLAGRWHLRWRCSRSGGWAARCLGERRALLAVLAQEGVRLLHVLHAGVQPQRGAAAAVGGARPGRLSRLLRHRQLAACTAAGRGSACWRHSGMLGKYTTALLLLSLLLLAVLHPRLPPRLGRPGPWLAVGRRAAAAAAAPARAVADRLCPALFPVRARAGPRTIGTTTSSTRCCSPAAQFGDIAAALLAVALLAWRRAGEHVDSQPTPLPAEQRAYSGRSPGRPAGLAVAASVILGLHLKDMWGYPMWCFIGLFLMAEVVGPIHRRWAAAIRDRLGRHPGHRAGVFASADDRRSYLMRKPMRGQFPGRELARRLSNGGTRRWSGAAGDRGWRCLAGRQHRVLR